MELDPKRTALLAVHLQGDVVTREGAFAAFFADMVEKTGVMGKTMRLLAAGRAAGATIAYLRIVFSEGHPELSVTAPLWEIVDQTKCLVDGTSGAAIVAEATPLEGELVIDHHRIDGTIESDLIPELRARGVDTVVVFGVATNITVETTARTLADHRFRVFVVADACTAGDEATHDAAIATLGLVTSGVASVDQVVSTLSVGAPS